MTTVSCPNCGKAIEVTEALVHQIQEKLTKDIEEKHKEELLRAKSEVEISIRKQLINLTIKHPYTITLSTQLPIILKTP